jgi:hypothetical protein
MIARGARHAIATNGNAHSTTFNAHSPPQSSFRPVEPAPFRFFPAHLYAGGGSAILC